MGSVYLAEHPGIGKKVALKVLHNEFSSNQEVAARFFNEAKAVNDIGHPNIVDIHDFGIIQGAGGRGEQLVYFIMEYLAGQALSTLLRAEAPLPPERALSIGLQVADALAASHKCNIVHRDLKPDNIMLIRRARESDFVKLLDFGIAKLTGDVAGSRRTRTGIVMGTPAYMSPEQCEGRGNIDHRTDIYALGIVLYEMMTGRVPFLGEGYGEILVQHLTQPPIPPSQFRLMNAHVEAVVMKALEKRPDMRYPTMDEMMRAMSDPVGYVEAHGGILGFMHRQLTPSSAPLPQARMTPAPTGSLTAPTPVPGHLTPYGVQVASLPTAVGNVAPKKTKLPLLIAAGLVVVGASAAVAYVVTNKSSGTAPTVPTPTPSGSAPVVTPADTQPNPGSAMAKTVEPAGSAAPAVVDATTGSGSAAPTSPGGEPLAKKTARLTFKTKPLGAEIWIDGKPVPDVITPLPFEFPVSKNPVKITLRKEGYEDIHLHDFVVSEDGTFQQPDFKKKGRSSSSSSSRGSGRPPGKGSSQPTKGSGTSNDTGLMRPD